MRPAGALSPYPARGLALSVASAGGDMANARKRTDSEATLYAPVRDVRSAHPSALPGRPALRCTRTFLRHFRPRGAPPSGRSVAPGVRFRGGRPGCALRAPRTAFP